MENKSCILFFGQLRTNEVLINNFVNNLVNSTTDIYFHFWKYEKDKSYLNINEYNIKNIAQKKGENIDFDFINTKPSGTLNGVKYYCHDDMYSNFIEKIKPKKYIIEEQIIFNNNLDLSDENQILFQRRISPIYSIIQGLNLIRDEEIRNNSKYKNVFICRPNINFINPMNLSSFVPKTNEILGKGSNSYFIDYNIISTTDTFLKLYNYTLNNLNVFNCEYPELTLGNFCTKLGIYIKNLDISTNLNGYRYGLIYPHQFNEYLQI